MRSGRQDGNDYQRIKTGEPFSLSKAKREAMNVKNITFEILNKACFLSVCEALFDILADNMEKIAPTGNTREYDYKCWFNGVSDGLRREERQLVLIKNSIEIIGFFQYYINEDTFMMEEIQFKPTYHGKGLFRQLFGFLLENINAGTNFVEAYANKENHKSIGILKKLGLSVIGTNKSASCYHFKGNFSDLKKWYKGCIDTTIEPLDPGDYQKCSAVWNMKSQPLAGKWLEEIKAGNRQVFIYKINGEFIGEGALVFDTGDPDYTIEKRRVYVSRMIVKKEYRNRGIGSEILEFLIKKAKEAGFTEMTIGVDNDNANALHLYRKYGFTEILFDGADENGEYLKLMKNLY